MFLSTVFFGVCLMLSLGQDQQDLIFAHSLGMSEGPDLLRAEELIAGNRQAAQMDAVLREAVAPLSFMPPEHCPDALADHTFRCLCMLAQAQRRARSGPAILPLGWGRRLSNATGVTVVAACLVLIVGVLVPSSHMMRQRYGNLQCRSGLGRLFQAIGQYSADYAGFLPAVARADGAPWHAIGDQNVEGGSNTRGPFLLLTLRYTDRPEDFLCCAKTRDGAPPLTPAEVMRCRDFPSRDHITYSYRLMPGRGVRMASLGRQPLMADMNPHFESVKAGDLDALRRHLEGESLRRNSANHGRRGQNLLGADGHARYSRTRFVGASSDDIYTMEGDDVGDGCRLPSRLGDVMLAP